MSKQVEKIPSPSSSITYPAKSKHKAALLDLPSETEARGAPPVAHSFGNIGVHYGASPQIQPKLTVGPVNDAYEQEADRVAAQVVNQINTPTAQRQETPEEDKEKLRTKPLISSLQRQEEPDKKEEEVRTKAESASLQRQETPEEDKDKLRAKPLISSLQRQEEPEKEEEVRAKAEGTSLQRQAMPEEDEEKLRTKPRPSSLQRQEEPEEEEEVRTKPQLQRKPDGSRVVTPDLEQAITERRGSGQSLPASTREPMEQAFGADFSKVKVHTDAQADQLNRSVQARAFTTGHDIFFRQGEHAPGTRAGQELLAHELTHVVQQNGGQVSQGGSGMTVPLARDAAIQEVVGNRSIQRLRAKGNLKGAPSILQFDTATVADNIKSELKTKGVDIRNAHFSAIQRDNVADTSTNTRPRSMSAALAQASLDEIRGQVTSRSVMLGAYVERGIQVAQKARSKMERFGGRYRFAYTNYSNIIRNARREAQNQQQWIDVFAGIAIGVSAGLISGAFVGEAVLTTAQKVLIEVLGETAEALAAGGARRVGLIPQVAGQELEPGGLSPDLVNTQIWQTLTRMYREITRIQQISWHLPLLLGNTEYALGQLRLLEAGADADMQETDVIDLAISLGRANRAIQPLDRGLTQKLAILEGLNSRLDASPNYLATEIEQDIWIIWMSSLTDDDSDILDLDAIENHLTSISVLGEGSRLGVNFGRWTSKSDELEALAAARSEARAIRARFDSMTSGGET